MKRDIQKCLQGPQDAGHTRTVGYAEMRWITAGPQMRCAGALLNERHSRGE